MKKTIRNIMALSHIRAAAAKYGYMTVLTKGKVGIKSIKIGKKQITEHSNSVEVFQTELELHTDQDLELLLKTMHRLEHMVRDQGNLFEKVIHRTLAGRNM